MIVKWVVRVIVKWVVRVKKHKNIAARSYCGGEKHKNRRTSPPGLIVAAKTRRGTRAREGEQEEEQHKHEQEQEEERSVVV